MGRKASVNLRRWLGLSPSFRSIGLYGNSTQLRIRVSSVVEEFMVAKYSLVMTLIIRDSADERTGRKGSAKTLMDQGEIMSHLRDIIVNTSIGRQDVGISHFKHWSQLASAAERRTEEDQR